MKQDDLINHLREEAHSVKDCFTRFSFQAIAISAAVIGIIIRFQYNYNIVSISSLSVTILVLAVAKIGNHKYNTANRNLGFILYLERMETLKKEKPEIIVFSDSIPWEEAMRAWRIVQATAFSKVYRVGRILPNKKKLNCKKCRKKEKKENRCQRDEFWFEPFSIAKRFGAKYYAGSYLEAVQTILFFMAGISLIPLAISSLTHYDNGNYLYFFITISIIFITVFIIFWRIRRIIARRKILESGLLSIHSCGILWEAVIIAHRKALLETIEKNKNQSNNNSIHLYESYTENISKIAKYLSEDICVIHNWIESNRIDELAKPTHALDRKNSVASEA